MHLEVDNQGYVCCILYGCITGSCFEYTGAIPSGYSSYDDWADNAKVQAYYLNSNGNLTYDAAKAATLPDEDEITPYTAEQCAELGIAPANHTHDFDVDTSKISDIICGESGKLKIGKTIIAWGTASAIAINNNHSGYGSYTIDYSSAGFASVPSLTITPFCERDAAAPYGVMAYVREQSASSATVRATSNFTTSQLSVGIHWLAIGIAS